MVTTKAKKGGTAQRIYNLLRRNPDLTTNEIAQHLPDVSPGMVQVTVSRMRQRGEIGVRGKKFETGSTGKSVPHNTYYAKRNVKKKPALTLKKQPAPKPVVATQPTWNPAPIKPEPEGPTTPMAEREVLVLRHLTDIYKSLSIMTEQQEALIEVLKGTLADLAETKDELEQERQRRNWWDKVKELF